MSFADLGLSPELLRAIEDLNYNAPTPIQEKAIPYVLMGRDVIGVAQTGTGKTASFTLPMIDILSGGRAKARMPRSLILSPTRELATQIAVNFDQFTKYQTLTKALLIGGESMEPQLKLLDRGVDVLIATPGRLLDLFERGKIMLNDIKIFVIDEADRMLDMGFIPDIERIGSLLSPMRQTLLFSATMPPEIKRLGEKFLSNPKEVAVAPPATVTTTVAQHLIKVDERQKRAMLRHLIRQENITNAMIFCNRKRDVQTVADSLKRHGFNAAPLHGDLVQSVRTETLDKFRANEIEILVCSDVAARGLDIKGVSHVFNFDVPFNAEDYVHRIGRTGRAGASGIAYTLVTPDDEKLLANIHAITRQEIPLIEIADFVPDERAANARPDRGGRGDRGGRDRGGDRGNRRSGGGSNGGRERERGPRPALTEIPAAATEAAAAPTEQAEQPQPREQREPRNERRPDNRGENRDRNRDRGERKPREERPSERQSDRGPERSSSDRQLERSNERHAERQQNDRTQEQKNRRKPALQRAPRPEKAPSNYRDQPDNAPSSFGDDVPEFLRKA